MMKFHPKQQYTILFQWNFILGVYLLQEKSYLTFHTGQNFWRALSIAVFKLVPLLTAYGTIFKSVILGEVPIFVSSAWFLCGAVPYQYSSR